MKKKFSVEQIVSVLKQAEVGVPIAELIRKVGITIRSTPASSTRRRNPVIGPTTGV
jgi:hypothetical protein